LSETEKYGKGGEGEGSTMGTGMRVRGTIKNGGGDVTFMSHLKTFYEVTGNQEKGKEKRIQVSGR